MTDDDGEDNKGALPGSSRDRSDQIGPHENVAQGTQAYSKAGENKRQKLDDIQNQNMLLSQLPARASVTWNETPQARGTTMPSMSAHPQQQQMQHSRAETPQTGIPAGAPDSAQMLAQSKAQASTSVNDKSPSPVNESSPSWTDPNGCLLPRFRDSFEVESKSLQETLSEALVRHRVRGDDDADENQPSTTYPAEQSVDGDYVVGVLEPRPNSKRVSLRRQLAGKGAELLDATLLDGWSDTPINRGDIIGLRDCQGVDSSGQITVEGSRGLVIVKPDEPTRVTSIGRSYHCMRREVIQERYKDSAQSKATVNGTVGHDLLDAALRRAFGYEDQSDEQMVEVIIQRNVEELYAVGIDDASVREKLFEQLGKLKSWLSEAQSQAGIKVTSFDSETGKSEGSCNGDAECVEQVKLPRARVFDVEDIESFESSGKYGLKGRLDAVLRVESSRGTDYVPFEFKTGQRNEREHGSQARLYSLLMAEKKGSSCYKDALLGYLEVNEAMEAFRVTPSHEKTTHIMQQRNELAASLAKETELPDIECSESICRKCDQLEICSALHKEEMRWKTPPSRQASNFHLQTAQHLSDLHLNFIKFWDEQQRVEGKECPPCAKMWLSPQEVRAKGGCCVDGLYMADISGESSKPSMLFRFTHSGPSSSQASDIFGGLKRTDLVQMSVLKPGENRASVAGRGTVEEVETVNSPASITVRGVSEVVDTSLFSQAEGQSSWRIERDGSNTLNARARNAVVSMGKRQYRRLRELLIEYKPPRFHTERVAYESIIGASFGANLNQDQERAVQNLTNARDYALLHGLPGTGKSLTLAATIKALLESNSTVLVAAHTNSAVDTLLETLLPFNVNFLRVGERSNVRESIKPFCVDLKSFPSISHLHAMASSINCVACTCSSVHNSLVRTREFDFAVVDEASQITLPTVLRALMLAKAFILAGDHMQLPPLVASEEARRGGLSQSLFETLARQHPSSVQTLRRQYRMAGDIMSISNRLVYSGNEMVAGNQRVSSAALEVDLSQCGALPSFLSHALRPSQRVCFLDTQSLPHRLQNEDNSNSCEADIVLQLTSALLHARVPPEEIAILTPFNSQVHLIRQGLRASGVQSAKVFTIDKSQGIGVECVILSLVCSNSGNVSPLIDDRQRMNVALTRAKKKLIIVGDSSTVMEAMVMAELVIMSDEHHWTIHCSS